MNETTSILAPASPIVNNKDYVNKDTGAQAGMSAEAQRLGRLGWPVFPLQPATKIPAIKEPQHRASCDPAAIDRMWLAGSRQGIAVWLDRADLLVIGPDCAEALAEFERRGLPRTAVAESQPGHRHYFYRRPAGCPTTRLCRPKEYDILTSGPAVLPPSIHPTTGKPRRWLVAPWALDELPEAPAWAVELLTANASRRRSGHQTAPAPIGGPADPPPVALSGEALSLWTGESFVESESDTGQTIDRSATLFAIGRELGRAGISARWIAAAVEDRDRALGYNKYVGRSDAAERYAEIGAKTASEPAPADMAPEATKRPDTCPTCERLTAENARLTEENKALHQLQQHPRTSTRAGAVWALAKRLRRAPTVATRVCYKDVAAEGATSSASVSRLVADFKEAGALTVTERQQPAKDGRPPMTEMYCRLVDARLQDATGTEVTPATIVGALLHGLPNSRRTGPTGATHGGADVSGKRRGWCSTCRKVTRHIVERRRIERCADCQTIVKDELTIEEISIDGARSTVYHGAPCGAPHGQTPAVPPFQNDAKDINPWLQVATGQLPASIASGWLGQYVSCPGGAGELVSIDPATLTAEIAGLSGQWHIDAVRIAERPPAPLQLATGQHIPPAVEPAADLTDNERQRVRHGNGSGLSYWSAAAAGD